MGSTYVTFHGQGFEASDTALEVWLTLLVREIDRLKRAPAWLREARDEWELQATAGFGFGVIPGLDRFVTSEEQRLLLLKLARRALKALKGYGDTLTRDELNSWKIGGEGTAFTQDAPVSEFVRPARYFIKLLEGNLDPWETDSRFEQG